MTFIRTYYLYLFYWRSIKLAKRKGTKPSIWDGFLPVAFLDVGMFNLALWLFFDAVFPDIAHNVYDAFLEIGGLVRTHKGEVNFAFTAFIIGLSIVLGYFLCFHRVTFKSIPSRLARYTFFKEFSWFKLFLPSSIWTVMVIMLLSN